MISLVLAVVGVATGTELRATVQVSDDGIDILAFRPGRDTPRVRPPLPVSGARDHLALQVRGADGEALARVDLPDPRERSVIFPDGGGASTRRKGAVIAVDVPWPEGASYVTDQQGRRWQPGQLANPPAVPPPPAVQLLGGAPSDERLDLVIMSEGYRADQLGTFETDADALVAFLLTIDPWGRYADAFNIWRVDVASVEAGAGASELTTLDTAFSCFYGCGGNADLVCCDDDAVTAAAEAAVPGTEGTLVLVNSNLYGGSGGANYATSFNGAEMLEVAAHELAHSLVGLRDEYTTFQKPDPAPTIHPNCSPLQAPHWDEWTGTKGVGSFLGCTHTDLFRPVDTACKMHALNEPFCPVCRQWTVISLHAQLPGLVTAVDPPPDTPIVPLGGATTSPVGVEVTIETVLPDDMLEFTWFLDGVDLGITGPAAVLGCHNVSNSGLLTVLVRDSTPWVRDQLEYLEDEAGPWPVDATSCVPVDTGLQVDDDKPAKGCRCDSRGLGASAGLGIILVLGLGRRRRWAHLPIR